MPYGYNGKILHVNLTTGELSVEEPEEKFYRKYMGGSALGLYYLLKEMPAGADPLGPDNVLVLALSVITGAPISGQSRLTAAAKSPLTGGVGDSQCGGFFPAELKFAGFEAIVIKGRAPQPVYLWIHDGQAELREAAHLWGRVTGEVEASIQGELGDKRIQVLQCGPAGEKGVRFAALINMSNRANGRTGMGAVMGSKNLKAVAVRGHQKIPLADAERFAALHGERSLELRSVLHFHDVPSGLREEAGQSSGLDPRDHTIQALAIQVDDQRDIAEALKCRVGDRFPHVAFVEFGITDGRDEAGRWARTVVCIDETASSRGEQGRHGAESDRSC